MLRRVALVLALCASPALAGDSAAAVGENGMLDLTPWLGRVVLVDFWASWCGPCLESLPWMGRMLERYGDRGLTVVAVNLDQDERAARRFLEGTVEGFRHVNDPEGRLPEAYGVTVMPSSILFDRQGQPAYRHEGFHADRVDEYERRIVALLEGREDPGRVDVVLGSTGSTGIGVKPWQRGLLADDAMRLDADPLDRAIDDHIYFSKEASSGGRGFGGGGCGCN